MDIGGEPVFTLERPAPPDAGRSAFLGAQILPGRGMMTLQIRAHLAGRGATDLLAAPFRQVDRATTDEQDSVRGSFHAGDFEGRWLSATEVTCEVVLRSDAFTLAVTARNVGDELLPMGIGWHPYFALPSGRRTQARLHVPARRRLLVHDYDEVIPTSEVAAVAGTPYDFTAPEGRALGDLFLDDCFVDLDRTAVGSVVAEVLDPEAGYGVRVVTDAPHLRAIQVYAPQDIGFIALEPQFNWVDPFGPEWGPEVDTGMATLAPGESAAYRVRLELLGSGG